MQKVSPRCCQAFGYAFLRLVHRLFLPPLPPFARPSSGSALPALCGLNAYSKPDQTSCLFAFLLLLLLLLLFVLPQSLNYLVFQLFVVGFGVAAPPPPPPPLPTTRTTCFPFGLGSLHFRSVVIKKIMTPNCTRSGISLLVAQAAALHSQTF